MAIARWPPNNSMQRTALRAAADAERYTQPADMIRGLTERALPMISDDPRMRGPHE
jgi:hypothetical protein